MEQYYRIKTVPFLSSHVNILCQKENGPCPILAIANALILLKRLAISAGTDVVSSTSLLNALANIALEQYRPAVSGGAATASLEASRDGSSIEAHRLQHINDVIQLLPRLLVGMDVNVYFHGVDKFEFTPEMSVFDAYGVSLYHGWVAPPTSAIGSTSPSQPPTSYNHLITELVRAKERRDAKRIEMQGLCARSDAVDKLPETAIAIATEIEALNAYILEAEQFLSETSSQLTPFGLHSLRDAMNSNQLAVFFRNNHFSTMLKFDNKLYLLVTDEGYINEAGVVWERLDDILGNNELVDGYFTTFVRVGASKHLPSAAVHQSMQGTVCAPPSKALGLTAAIVPTVLPPPPPPSGSGFHEGSGGSEGLGIEPELAPASAPPAESHGEDADAYHAGEGEKFSVFTEASMPELVPTTPTPSPFVSDMAPSLGDSSALDPSELTSNVPIDTLAVQRSLGTVTQAFDVAAATARMYRKSEVAEERDAGASAVLDDSPAADVVSLESDMDGVDFDNIDVSLSPVPSSIESRTAASSTYVGAMSDSDYAIALQLQESMEAESLAARREQERLNMEAAEALLRQEMLGAGATPGASGQQAYTDTHSFAAGASMGVAAIDPAAAQFTDDPAEAERLIRTQEWILQNIQSGAYDREDGDDGVYPGAGSTRYAAQSNMSGSAGREKKSRRSEQDRRGCVVS